MALLTGLMTFLNLLALPGSVILDDLEFIYSECWNITNIMAVANESNLVDLIGRSNFMFEPHSDEPITTVRIRNYFVADESGTMASFDNDNDGTIHGHLFLHGDICSWDGDGQSISIAGIPVRKWWVSYISTFFNCLKENIVFHLFCSF